jgi:hypothetical protein
MMGRQRIFLVGQAESANALHLFRQHHIIVRHVRHGEGTHLTHIRSADSGRRAHRTGGQQTEFAFGAFNGDVALANGLGGE